ncbi:MAG: hypothetical protein AB2693_16130 [Candidatus Thiodiazotropha sp.]
MRRGVAPRKRKDLKARQERLKAKSYVTEEAKNSLNACCDLGHGV